MRRLFLRDCAAGDVVEDVFILTNKQLAATSSGKYYIKAFCSDRTSQVTARIWNATRELFNSIPDNGFARVRGRIENYQNNLQLIIEHVGQAKDGTFDIADLMPHTTRDVDEMCRRLFELCGSIQNRHLKALIQAYLDDEALMNDFSKAPAAVSFHHAFLGGLLEHTLNSMEVADAVCKFYPTLNRDIVVAGVFLHDLAKTWELSYDSAFSYTDGGQLIGHVVKGAMWVEEKARLAATAMGEPIPRALIDVMQHIILSHHGDPAFGAARVPSTPEAIAVHVIENLDAKLMMALGASRGDGAMSEGNWTEYLKAFNGRIYRPDVAPGVEEELASRNGDTHGGASPIGDPRRGDSHAAPAANGDVNGARGDAPPATPVRIPPPTQTNEAAPKQTPKSAAGAPKLAITNPLFESTPNRKR